MAAKADTSILEIRFGLYSNQVAGFGYSLKRNERLSNGYSVNTASDFTYQNKMLEKRGNKYLVEIQSLKLEDQPVELKVLSITLIGLDKRPLPFSVLYKMPDNYL